MADKILAVSLFTQWSDKAVTMGRDVVDAAVAFIEEAAKTPAESPKTKEGGQVDEGTGVDADEEVDGDAEVDEDCEVDDTEEDSEVNMEDGYVIDDEDADGVIKGAEDPKVPTDGEPQVA